MPGPLEHPEGCGCMVCRRWRERLESDPRARELEAGAAPQSAGTEPGEHSDSGSGPDQPAAGETTVHEHHHETVERHEHVTHEHHDEHVTRQEVINQHVHQRAPRPRRQRTRRGGLLRTIAVGVVLIWLLHSFYPGLNVPLVPGVSTCTTGSVQPAGLSLPIPAPPVIPPLTPDSPYPPSKVLPKVGDLAADTLGHAAKRVLLVAAGVALHAAGDTVRHMVAAPPTVDGIRAGLDSDMRAVGRVVGFVTGAFTGRPVTGLVVENGGGPMTVAPVSTCAPCGPTVGVPAASSAVDGIDTAARAALRAGWTDEDAVTAVAIAGAESGYRHDARNPSGASGMWQTMMPMHADLYHGADWRDPYANARVGHILWESRGWQPWTTYTSGAYRSHLGEARAAVTASVGGATLDVVAHDASGDGPVSVDGKRVSAVTARQIALAEQIGHVNLTVVQGGYGGDHVAASGTSHDYPGVADIVPGTTAVERLLRTVGFAAWARNVEGRRSVGSGAHVHSVSLLEPGDKTSPQVYGSWAGHKDGLDGGPGSDPAPHYAWIPNLVARVGGTPLTAQPAAAKCAHVPGSGGGGSGGVVATSSTAGRTGGRVFALASLNVHGASHTGAASADARLPRAVQVLARHQVDVVGFQEMQHRQAALFDRLAGGTFARWSGSGDTDNSIAWRRGVFDFVSGTTLPVPYFNGGIRHMPAVTLRYRPTGQEMVFLNGHNPADTGTYHHQARWRAAAIRVELPFLNRAARSGLPVFWTGDMNDHAAFYGPVTAGSGMRGSSADQYGGIDWVLHSPGQRFLTVRTDDSPLVDRTTDHPFVVATVAAPVTAQAGGK